MITARKVLTKATRGRMKNSPGIKIKRTLKKEQKDNRHIALSNGNGGKNADF